MRLTTDEIRLLLEVIDGTLDGWTIEDDTSGREKKRGLIDKLSEIRKTLAAEIDMDTRAGVATPETKGPKP